MQGAKGATGATGPQGPPGITGWTWRVTSDHAMANNAIVTPSTIGIGAGTWFINITGVFDWSGTPPQTAYGQAEIRIGSSVTGDAPSFSRVTVHGASGSGTFALSHIYTATSGQTLYLRLKATGLTSGSMIAKSVKFITYRLA